MSNLDNPAEYIKSTGRIIRSGQHTQEALPNAIKSIIENKLWLKVKNKKGQYFKSFEELCVHEPWEGLDTTLYDLDVYLRKSPDVKKLVIDEVESYNNKVKESKKIIDIEDAKENPLLTNSESKIGNKNSIGSNQYIKKEKKDDGAIGTVEQNNKKIKISKGSNSKEYQLKRLARDAPEILSEYEKGAYKSVREAALAAGIVKQKTIYEQIIPKIKKLNKQELLNLKNKINEIINNK